MMDVAHETLVALGNGVSELDLVGIRIVLGGPVERRVRKAARVVDSQNLIAYAFTSNNFGALYFNGNHLRYWQAGVLRAETPETACARLVERANGAGGKDNVTVVVAAF